MPHNEYWSYPVPAKGFKPLGPIRALSRRMGRPHYTALYRGRSLRLSDASCLEYIWQHVQNKPSAPALSMQGHSLTFADLAGHIEVLSHWLLHRGACKPGDRLAICMPNSLGYLVAVLAAWHAGLIVANLNYPQVPPGGQSCSATKRTIKSRQEHKSQSLAAQPLATQSLAAPPVVPRPAGSQTTAAGAVEPPSDEDILLAQLQDCGARLLMTTHSQYVQLEKILLRSSIRQVVTTQNTDFASGWTQVKNWLQPSRWKMPWRTGSSLIEAVPLQAILKNFPGRQPAYSPPDMHSVALIQYRCNPAGQAQGVALTHANLSANYQQAHHLLGDEISGHQTALCPLPLQQLNAVSFCLLMLCSGVQVALTTTRALLGKSRQLAGVRPDSMLGNPDLYQQLLAFPAAGKLVQKARLFMCGGGQLSSLLQAQWHRFSGHYVCQGYALAEASPLVSFSLPHRLRPDTAGFILPNTAVCVVGAHQQRLGFNQLGELWIKGPQVMQGYWHNPRLTRQHMRADNWFNTGDVGMVCADGYLQVLERPAGD